MSNIVVNAPIQNKEFNPDEQWGKIVPLYAAEWLQTQTSSTPDPPVQNLWNNVLATEQNGMDEHSYRSEMQRRLHDKYESIILRSLIAPKLTPAIRTDTDYDFTSWASERVEEAVQKRDLQIHKVGVYVCSDCDATLAVQAGPKPLNCVGCPATANVIATQRPTLLGRLDNFSRWAVDEATGTQGATKDTLFVANKRRLNGIGLEAVGFPNDVLDPRVGLGLLAVYTALKDGSDTVTIVSSRATIRQNLEHFFTSIRSQYNELPSIQMAGIAKAPVKYLRYLSDESIMNDFDVLDRFRRRIIPILFRMKQDMSPACAEQLIFNRRGKC